MNIYTNRRKRRMLARCALTLIVGIGAASAFITYCVAMVIAPLYTSLATIGVLAANYIYCEVERNETEKARYLSGHHV